MEKGNKTFNALYIIPQNTLNSITIKRINYLWTNMKGGGKLSSEGRIVEEN